MNPQNQLDFFDTMWDTIQDYLYNNDLTEEFSKNEVRNLVDQIWEAGMENADTKSFYDDGYEGGLLDGESRGFDKGYKEGFEEAKEQYQVKVDQPDLVPVTKTKKTKVK